jgi:glutathione peroxidase
MYNRPMKSLKDKIGLQVAKWIFRGGEMKRKLKEGSMKAQKSAAPAGEIYKFTMKTIDGQDRPLSSYRGKVLLLVNVASKCGFTPQYDSLEELYKRYKDKGFVVLGFPANEFGAQEPGTDADIKAFCGLKYGVTFDMFSKIVVKGAAIHPLYEFLTTKAGHNGEIPWNFSKFLVAKDGSVAERFGPDADPFDANVVAKIEELLKA